jgi:hypothetical protein
VWVKGVQGMTELNREPERQRPHSAKRLDIGSLEINALSAAGLRPTGGQLIYRKPVDLAESAAEMVIWRGDDLVLALTLGNGLAVTAPGTIERVLTAEQTALLVGEGLTYTLEITFVGPTVTRYFEGAVGKSTCGGCPDGVAVTAGEQGPPGVGAAEISADPSNRITFGSDLKLYVSDDLIPDPLAYYILAKG